MTILHIDLETFSESDLGEEGVYKYAEHESTSINVVGYAVDGGGVHLWLPFDEVPLEILNKVIERFPGVSIERGTRAPEGFLRYWNDPTVQKRAHNAQFERVVLAGVAGKKLGLEPRPIEEWVCTAVKCAANGLPRSLDHAAKAMGTHPKSEGGRVEMLQLAKPRRPSKADPSTRWHFGNAPEKWIAMLCYNVDDVIAERDLDDHVPDLPEREQRLYVLDQKINQRGWKVDLEAVHNILFVVEQYKGELAAECRKLTAKYVFNEKLGDFELVGLEPTQREKIADWVREQGVRNLPDMQAETIKWIVKTEIPSNVKRVLLIYSTYNAKSVSKLQAMLRAVCADGRLRGMFLFYGAATGRWSSLIVQLQNMLRPLIKDPNTAIEAFASRDINLIRMLWPDVDPMKVAGSCIRGCLVADNGKDLVFPDYSGVEDRVNLWFFDEEQWLEIYKQYDAKKGRHPYSITVCQMLGLDLATFDDEDPRRQIGKVTRLQLGYEGGVSAFVSAAENYGIDLEAMAKIVIPLLPPEALDHAKWMRENHPNKDVSGDVETACNGLKFMYRAQQPKIRQGWRDLKEAAEKAVEFKGEAFWLPNRRIGFKVVEYKGREWLAMRLPSGRSIKYYKPSWTPPRESERWINGELVPYTVPGYMEYWGIDTYTRQWMKLQTYGGKLDENADQGFSRDLLCNAMLALDAEGFPLVGSEHDKAILEILAGGPETVEKIKSLMLKPNKQYAGLPLATDGKRMKRYGK